MVLIIEEPMPLPGLWEGGRCGGGRGSPPPEREGGRTRDWPAPGACPMEGEREGGRKGRREGGREGGRSNRYEKKCIKKCMCVCVCVCVCVKERESQSETHSQERLTARQPEVKAS